MITCFEVMTSGQFPTWKHSNQVLLDVCRANKGVLGVLVWHNFAQTSHQMMEHSFVAHFPKKTWTKTKDNFFLKEHILNLNWYRTLCRKLSCDPNIFQQTSPEPTLNT